MTVLRWRWLNIKGTKSQERKELYQSEQAMACCSTNLQTTKASNNKGLCPIFRICRSRVIGFAGGLSGEEPTCQCRRHRRLQFSLWVQKIPWKRAWQPTPVFLPGESQGQRSLVGYCPWGRKESDTTEQLSFLLCVRCELQACIVQYRAQRQHCIMPINGIYMLGRSVMSDSL